MAVEAVPSSIVGVLERAFDDVEPALGAVAPALAAVVEPIAAAIQPLERMLLDLFALNVLLQIVDGLLTYNALQLGFGEGNPLLVASFVAIGPLSTLCLVKANSCGLLLLVRRAAPTAFGAAVLRGTALGYALLAVVPWIGKLSAFAALTFSLP